MICTLLVSAKHRDQERKRCETCRPGVGSAWLGSPSWRWSWSRILCSALPGAQEGSVTLHTGQSFSHHTARLQPSSITGPQNSLDCGISLRKCVGRWQRRKVGGKVERRKKGERGGKDCTGKSLPKFHHFLLSPSHPSLPTRVAKRPSPKVCL